MLRTVTGLILALVATVAAASAAGRAAAPASAGQPLGITITAGGSHVQRLDGYATAKPIAVRVDAPPRAEGVTLLGLAPNGGNLRVPLSREADGRFGADITLAMPGIWSLAVSSRVGVVETASESFAVSVLDGASGTSVALVFALAVVSLAAGMLLILFGVTSGRRPVPSAG